MQDKDGEKGVLSYEAFLLIPVYTKCFAHLLLAAAYFWLWSMDRHRVMQMGEELCVVGRVSVRHPSPPWAPPHRPPIVLRSPALPAVLGSWRAIFNKSLHFMSEAEATEA